MTDTSPRHRGHSAAPPVSGPAASTPSGSSPVKRGKTAALAVIAVAQLLIVLDGTIVSVALPSLEADLGISAANRSWVVTLYALTFGGLLLLGGRVADHIGRRRSLTVGLLAFAASSVLGAAAPDATVLFAARALQGASAALLAPSALSLLAVTFTEPRERARAFGVFGAVSAAGGAIGLLAGGVLTEFVSWRWCLGVAAPIAVLTAVAARAVFAEARRDSGPRSLDVAGAVTVTAGLAALVLGLARAGTDGWAQPSTIALFVGAAVLVTAFVIVEARSTSPLLPLRVVSDRNRGGAYLVQILFGAALLSVFVFLTFYLQQTLGFSPLRTGFSFLPVAVGIGLGAAAYAALSSRVRPGVQIPVGMLVAAGGLALLTRIGVTSDYWVDVLPGIALIAFGAGLTLGPVANVALVGITDRDAGVASALVDTNQQVGGAIGTAVLNTVFASAVTGYLADAASSGLAAQPSRALADAAALHGYHVTFWTGAGILVAGAVAAFVLITVSREQMARVDA